MSIPFNPKRCPHCKKKMDAGMRIHAACIDGYAQANAEKSDRACAKRILMAAKIDKALTKKRLETLKSRGQWMKEAQTAFNQFIRARDAGMACICCGRFSAGMVPGGDFDAGHYRSRGSAPHLKYDERNVHAQLKQCNRYDSGNIVGYRVGLIERIGLQAVDALESDQEPRRYTIEDLKSIKAAYTVKTRILKEQQA